MSDHLDPSIGHEATFGSRGDPGVNCGDPGENCGDLGNHHSVNHGDPR